MTLFVGHIGLRRKLLLATTLIILVIGATIITFVRIVFPRYVRSELQSNWNYITERLAEDAVDPVLSRDKLALRALVFEQKDSLADAEYVFLMDEEGNVLAHTFERGFPADLVELKLRDGDASVSREVLLGTRHVFDIGRPLLKGNLGEVHIGFTAESLIADTERIVGLIVATIVVALVLQIPLIGVLGSLVTRPVSRLRDLTEEVRRIGHGEHGREIRITSSDEIGELANAYNSMRSDLEEYKERLRSLASQLTLAEERERRRIAANLHDLLGQTMAMSKIKLGAVRERLEATGGTEAVDEIRDMIERMIADTHSLVLDLSPPVLYELGLGPALEWLCDETTDRHGVRVTYEEDDHPKPLDSDLEVVLFQSTRELLRNVVKHANARSVRVSFCRQKDHVRIGVQDDGTGFDTSSIRVGKGGSKGFGIFSVRERLNYFGSMFEIDSTPGQGTCATVTAPLQAQREHKHTS